MTAVQPDSAPSTTISRRDALGLLGFAGAGVVLGTTLARASTDADAPSLAGVQPGHYRFTIGDIEALAVNDGGFAVTPSESPFGIGEPREKVTEALRDALAPTDMMRLPFNVLLMRIGSELVMVDTGCGPTFGAVGGRLVGNLAAAGVKPEQITAEKLAAVRKLDEIAQARGQTLAQMAVAWNLRHRAMTSVLVGASRVRQIEDDVAALNNLVFTADELAAIERILAA